ncbi:hypothetical protein C4561_01395 [candidate division WWE3 bacterium]|uniref:Uncharacterized protein n=1 Tax=candidate division WWE3 bacterium TaxID=2053526 RepID=A0A3A4ZLI6_UNCKA|nr:MAG: hypothetical protein C4561_01395 [candidate division WWE3 bacterium]
MADFRRDVKFSYFYNILTQQLVAVVAYLAVENETFFGTSVVSEREYGFDYLGRKCRPCHVSKDVGRLIAKFRLKSTLDDGLIKGWWPYKGEFENIEMLSHRQVMTDLKAVFIEKRGWMGTKQFVSSIKTLRQIGYAPKPYGYPKVRQLG